MISDGGNVAVRNECCGPDRKELIDRALREMCLAVKKFGELKSRAG